MSKRRTVQNFLADLPLEPESSLPPSAIIIPTTQPRRYFDPDKLKQLIDSVSIHGILEPLLVRPIPDQPNKYELVAGERRYRAAVALNLPTIPVVIRELSDENALALSLVENLAREDLNPVEETEGILTLLQLELTLERDAVISLLYRWENEYKGKAVTHNVIGSEIDKQIQSVFEGLGHNRNSFIANRLPLLNLPEDILDILRMGKLAYTKARAIAKLKDREQREEILSVAIEENWSLSQIKDKILELKTQSSQADTSQLTPSQKITNTYQKLKKSKLWQSDPEKWQKLSEMLAKIDSLLEEPEEKKEDTNI